MSQRDHLLDIATRAIAGRIDSINVRRDGRAVLLNAGKDLIYTGFSPEAEVLKGLIVEVDRADRAVRLVAGCLPKFYNLGESATNDAAFEAALATPGARVTFSAKADGTNGRAYIHPDTGRIEFATRGMLQAASATGGYLGRDFASLMREIAAERYPALLDPALVGRYTVIFELIHPTNRIITDYGPRRDLPILAAIDLETGDELHREALETLCTAYRLSPVERYSPRASSFPAAVAELRAAWAGTDLEGMVVTVEHPDWAVPFRIKVKAERYLRIMRILHFCTLRRTKEMYDELRLDPSGWDRLYAHLHTTVSDLPEEVVAGYREHFERIAAWDNENIALRDGFVARFRASFGEAPFDRADHAARKAFALAFAADPDRDYFFKLRDGGAGPDAVARLLDAVRHERRDILRLGTEADDPSPFEA